MIDCYSVMSIPTNTDSDKRTELSFHVRDKAGCWVQTSLVIRLRCAGQPDFAAREITGPRDMIKSDL